MTRADLKIPWNCFEGTSECRRGNNESKQLMNEIRSQEKLQQLEDFAGLYATADIHTDQWIKTTRRAFFLLRPLSCTLYAGLG